MNEYEQQLLKYDPGFLQEHTMNAYTPKNSFLHYYTHGLGPYDPALGLELDQTYQLHLNVERIRVPEVFFQPGIVGLDQTGLVETLQDVLKRFDLQAREKMVQNILVTGGMAQIPGLVDRLNTSIQSILPFSPEKKNYHVRRAQDCLLDGWRGAAMMGRDQEKIKAKKQLREQLSDRRSHASQLRMKSIAALASDAPPPKRRRKGQDGKKKLVATDLMMTIVPISTICVCLTISFFLLFRGHFWS